jgi:hypothetical protein
MAMDAQKRKAIWMSLIGLILIMLGIKYLPFLLAFAGQQSSMNDQPVILFFNVDEPCECMVELTQRAEQQMANWPVERQGGIPVMRIAMEQRKDLELRYSVFRAPCLVLVDAHNQIVWRQDYPMIEGGPFKLEELEAVITELRSRKNYAD